MAPQSTSRGRPFPSSSRWKRRDVVAHRSELVLVQRAEVLPLRVGELHGRRVVRHLAAVVLVAHRHDQQSRAIPEEARVGVPSIGERGPEASPGERDARGLEGRLLEGAVDAQGTDGRAQPGDDLQVGVGEPALAAAHPTVRRGERTQPAALWELGEDQLVAEEGRVDRGVDQAYPEVLLHAGACLQDLDEGGELARDALLLLAHRVAVVDDEEDVRLHRHEERRVVGAARRDVGFRPGPAAPRTCTRRASPRGRGPRATPSGVGA